VAFGDGATSDGTPAARAYASPGVKNGTFTVRDRAGDATTTAFTVTVTAASGTTAGVGAVGIARIVLPGAAPRAGRRVTVRSCGAARVRGCSARSPGPAGPAPWRSRSWPSPRGTYALRVTTRGAMRSARLLVS
jgi:hypothetical protein